MPRKKADPQSTRPTKSAGPRPKPTVSVAKLQGELEEKIQLLSETNRQLKRKIFDLYTVFEISRNFNSVLDYQTLLDTFIFTCLGQVAALKAAIFLTREGNADAFSLAKAKGSGELPGADERISADSKLATFLRRLNRPVPTEDLLKDVASSEEASILGKFSPGIAVPLIYQTRLTGIFLLSDRITSSPFREDDIEFLSILANQIAVAIENARLYESERLATTQLRSAQQQLVHTEKLAALGEMSAKVAHEVNNPLGIIKNYLLLTRRSIESTEQTEKTQQYIGVVGDEIDRIARIVKQLLEMNRGGGALFEPVEVCKVVNAVLDLTDRQLHTANISIERQFHGCPILIDGASESLKQVFLNIIINARDAMAGGGKLTVGISRDNDQAVIRFCDTGPGIPPELVSRIFEPFFTTKDPGQGTGLGLSVCWGIVKSHNGSITFKNLDPGGCFEIRLPEVKPRGTGDVVV